MSKTITKTDKDLIPLSANEKSFSLLVAQGYSYIQAYLESFPAKKESYNRGRLKYESLQKAAWRLSRKVNVITEVDNQSIRLQRSADRAANRLDEIVEHGKEHNALDAAKFLYEQEHGKAVQQTEVLAKHVLVTYDLTGKNEPVPQEVLDQLADDDQQR